MKKLIFIILLSVSSLLARAQFCGPYTYHAPINLTGVSNLTISGDSTSSITLTSCTNIHITKCKISNNPGGIGIYAYNSTGITIDSVMVTLCGQGIYLQKCVSEKINNNYLLNILGKVGTTGTWHPIIIDNCTGGGQQIMNNKIEEIGVPYTHDQISVYQSYGLLGDSIKVWGNHLRGGQTAPAYNSVVNNGAVGITGGDFGGSYQSIRGNYLINTGREGILIDGNGTNIKVDHNYIYCSGISISLIGIGYFVGEGAPKTNATNYIGYNYINWKDFNGHISNKYFDASVTRPQGWTTNTADNVSDPLANAAIIATPQVTSCVVPPIINISGSPFVYVYGSTIANITPVNTGGAAASYSLIGTLPSGLSFSTTTGVISGTNTGIKSITSYQVIAINGSGRDTATISITVNKAILTIVPNLAFKFQGQVNPAFTASYVGFVPGDNVGSLTTPATVSTTAVTGSPAGVYTLTASGAVASNYTFDYSHTGLFIILPHTIGAVIHGPVIVLTH